MLFHIMGPRLPDSARSRKIYEKRGSFPVLIDRLRLIASYAPVWTKLQTKAAAEISRIAGSPLNFELESYD